MLEVRELTVAAIYVVLSVLQKLDLHFRNKTSILDAYIELDRSVAFGTFTKAVREMEIEISNVQFVHMEMDDGDIAFTVTFNIKKE